MISFDVIGKLLIHPLARDILEHLDRDDVVKAAPVELAKEWEIGLSNISYHFKVLRERGLILYVDGEQVRGATKHYYRGLTPEEWEHLGERVRECARVAKSARKAVSVPSGPPMQ